MTYTKRILTGEQVRQLRAQLGPGAWRRAEDRALAIGQNLGGIGPYAVAAIGDEIIYSATTDRDRVEAGKFLDLAQSQDPNP